MTGRSDRRVVHLHRELLTLGDENARACGKGRRVDLAGRIALEEIGHAVLADGQLADRRARRRHVGEQMVQHAGVARNELHGANPLVFVERQIDRVVEVVHDAGSRHFESRYVDDVVRLAELPLRLQRFHGLCSSGSTGALAARRAGVDPAHERSAQSSFEM